MAKKKAATKAARAAKNVKSSAKTAVKNTARTLKTVKKAARTVAKTVAKNAGRKVAAVKAVATKAAKKAKRSTAARVASLTKKAKASQKKAKGTFAATTKAKARPKVVARKAIPKKPVAKKAVARTSAAKKSAARKIVAKVAVAVVKKTAVKKAAVKTVAKTVVKAAAKPVKTVAMAEPAAKKPNLDRPRKTVADVHSIPSSLDMDRSASAARSGRAELAQELKEHTSSSPALTAGDVDADWQSAESTGDEAPGGDNPTPDQDVVEEIGRALGVEYADEEELQGGEEIADRDRHRWELDPESKEDFDEDR